MKRHLQRRGVRRVVAVIALTGAVSAAPAQAGGAQPARPAPTVTVTTDPALDQKLPVTVSASWTIGRPGQELDLLHVEGKVLVPTTVVAVWTSRRQLIKRDQRSIGDWYNFWAVTQAPVGVQSHQVVSRRITTARGTWGAWSDHPSTKPYADPTVGVDRVEYTSFNEDRYSGPTLPRGQVQYRLVLTLEPGTYVKYQDWNVDGP
jgi:hypothetical protein